MRVFAGVLALLFLFSAVVQWNDPDPVEWMAVYGAAAAVAATGALRRFSWPTAVVVGGIALGWAGFLVPRVWGQTNLADMFGHMGMIDIHAEEGREMIGLFIVAAGMAGLVAGRRSLRT